MGGPDPIDGSPSPSGSSFRSQGAPTSQSDSSAPVRDWTHLRKEQQEEAYQLQLRGAAEGALRWTVFGAALATLGHFTWPAFRKQTLALKGFLVSSATIFGMVTWADHYLREYEKTKRLEENAVRRQAQSELAGRGVIASEGEIWKWRLKKEKELADAQREGEPGKAREEDRKGPSE